MYSPVKETPPPKPATPQQSSTPANQASIASPMSTASTPSSTLPQNPRVYAPSPILQLEQQLPMSLRRCLNYAINISSHSLLSDSPTSNAPSTPGNSQYVPLRDILLRIESKLDRILEHPSFNSSFEPVPPAQQPMLIELTQEQPDNDLTPQAKSSQSETEDPETPAALHAISSSYCNFAVRLLRKFCSVDELKGRNIAGVRGQQSVDPEKVAKIMDYVFEYYPTPPSNRELVKRDCRKLMDVYLRRLNSKL